MTALDTLVRLSGIIPDTAPGAAPPSIKNPPGPKDAYLESEGDSSEGEKAVSASPAVSTTTAASLIPGMVISHPEITGGKQVQVVNHSHRGTHVEVIGKHVPNGRGFLARTIPSTIFAVHSMADVTGREVGSEATSNGTFPDRAMWSGPALGGGMV